MKLTAILLFTSSLQVSAQGLSPTVTISEKNAPLEKVFRIIEKQTGYIFYYKVELLQRAKRVDVSFKNANLSQVLDFIFKDQPLTYTIVQKNIVVQEKGPSNKNEGAYIPPAPGEIRGVVDGENGPVNGASIVSRKTGTGTSTNASGQYTLKGINDDDVLIISSVGYVTQEISIRGNASNYTRLKMAENKLDEVHVLAYGQATTRRLSTGSSVRVTAEEIQKQPVTNVLQALVGRVAGLSITQGSGLPGGNITFQVRGQNSVNADNYTSAPLVVIDGVPYPNAPISLPSVSGAPTGDNNVIGPGGYGNTLYNINPNDIESVEILKDADATAIYGSRAGNGVMLITTKKGKQGKTKVDVTAGTGVGLNVRRVAMLTTPEYLAMRREAFRNDNVTPDATSAPDLFLWDTTHTVNWQKELLGHTAHVTDVNVSMSGGAGGTSFLISGNYHEENYVYPDRRGANNGGAHYSLNHVSYNGRFSLTLSGSVSTGTTKFPEGDYGSFAYNLPPNFNAFDSLGNLNWSYNNGSNPYAVMKSSYSNKSFSLTSNLKLHYTILPGLEAGTSIGFNRVETDLQQIEPKASVSPTNAFFSSSNYMSNVRSQTLNVEPQMNYTRNIAGGKLAVLAGATIMKTINEMPSSVNAYNFNSDAYLNNIALAGTVTAVTGYNADQYASFFSQASYNRSNKYIFNGSFRRDGSSRFGPNNRFGNFGAVGAAWLFNKEKFAEGLHFLSFGKLRGSIGWVGSNNVGNYAFLSTYVPSSNRYAGSAGLVPYRLDNPDFQWENTQKLEVALELGFLKDRILLTTAWYQNRCANQLVNYPVSTQTGFSSYTANLNSALVENKGWEFDLNTTNINGKHFHWTTSFNLTIPQNKLLRFDGIERTSYISRLVVGKPIASIWQVHFTGVDATGTPQYLDANKNGVIDYNGLNAYGKGDLVYVGKSSEDYYGGLINNLNYKAFKLQFLFQYVAGKTQANYLQNLTHPGSSFNMPRKALEDLRNKGLDKALLRNNFTFDWFTYAGQSDALYMKVSYVRLANVSLSYDLPEKYLKPFKLSRFTAFVNAQNLFVISNYDGFDPESGATSMPPLFRLVGGIQCSF